MSPLSSRSRPQPAPPLQAIADQLDRITPEFDALLRDARLGHPLSARAYDELEARAQGIANMLVAAFRGAAAMRPPVNAPIGRVGRATVW